MQDFKEGFLILENKDREIILKELALNKTFKRYTFMTLKELKEKLTYTISKQALVALVLENGLKPEVASNYLTSLRSLNGIFATKKGEFLKEIYDFLDQKGLILEDKTFKDSALNSYFTFYHYTLNKDLAYVTTLLDNNYEIIEENYEELTKDIYVNTFKNIEQEIAYVFSKIYDLVAKGVKLEDIKLCNVDSEYTFLLNRYKTFYNLNIKQEGNKNILQTSLVKDFYNLAKTNSLTSLMEELAKKYDAKIVNQLINKINDYALYNYDVFNIKEVYDYIFKEMSFTKKSYKEEIEVIDIENIASFKDKYIFILNFNLDVPRIKKDEEYLTDSDKEILGIDTSNEINLRYKANLLSSLAKCENLTITFSKMHSFRNVIISPLLQEAHFKVKETKGDYYPIGYEKISDDMYLASSCDNLIKYNERNDMLEKYYYKELLYNTFDNKYKFKDKEKIIAAIPKPLSLSYTDMHSFLNCPFSYYLKKILKIDQFEVTLDTILGNYAHAILERYELKKENFSFDIDEQEVRNDIISEATTNGYQFSLKDEFYLNKMKENTKEVISFINSHKEHTRLHHVMCEKKMDVKTDKLIFKGFIDKLWYEEIDGVTYVAIIDYKTGRDTASLKNLALGENLQLPIYIYLMRHNQQFKNAKLVGFYLQKINIFNPNKQEKMTAFDQKIKNMKLEGYTNPDLVTYIDSTDPISYLKKYKYRKDGMPDSHSLVFNEQDEEEILKIVDEKIEECVKGINDADFKIVSKLIDKKNVSCTFCHFKDVCYKTLQDNLYLEGERKDDNSEGDDEDADE